MITESTTEALFSGGRSRVAPLTWGQQGTWDGIHEWLPEIKPFFTLTRWLPVPLVLSLPDVLEQLGELLNRHESLRTLYRSSARGTANQEVLAAGAVAVTVFDRPADDPVEFHDLVEESLGRAVKTAWDYGTELPIRFYVAMHEGIPVLVTFGVSHLSADYLSADLLSTELAALLQAKADASAPPAARSGMQPVDLAMFENSPDGQLLNVEAISYQRQQYKKYQPGMLPLRAEPLTPRFRRGELESDAVPVAVRAAARRHRTSPSAMLLAITTALVRSIAGADVYSIDIMQSNRLLPELVGAVTTLNQIVPTAIDLTADSFEEIVRQSTVAMDGARRHGRYDARAARAMALSLRGADWEPGSQLNDMWSLLHRPKRPVATDEAELRVLAEGTTFSWPEMTDDEGMVLFLDIRGTAERIQLSMMADTALLPPPQIQAFLYTFERTAIQLAVADVDLETLRL
ncbi:condensation domain-containing protein [Kribbella sp. CA-293567]|uniref:condensation domain-containing protein n=1 Tax=Kribbella sp. CA-293567 TaxID=3002436 RepID=UPI0022DD7BF4|nr:condensation domain-containing protein [Kribbella sp. CA-293567]WBQ05541.1 condensation domain-containing protein [Kribbella sp. CA-293567]